MGRSTWTGGVRRAPLRVADSDGMDHPGRSSRAWLPPGWFIAAYYWDVESGGLDLKACDR